MRLFLALGPGDIVGARRAKLAGKAVPETSIPFSEQIFSFCQTHQIETLAISSNERRDALVDGYVTMENRPKPGRGRRLRYHLSAIVYAIYLATRARSFSADFAIIDSGTTHFFALSFFRALGIPVFVNLHNVLWPSGFPPNGMVPRSVRCLNRLFFRHIASGAIGVSPECERQVKQEAGYPIPFEQYRCQFSLEGFKAADPYSIGIFRVAFVGRVERSKGALDIVNIAKRLRDLSPVEVVIEVCGSGGALTELQTAVQQEKLDSLVIVRGRLERSSLLDVYARAHAVVVPTRSDFCEGMPQSCAEAVISSVPVVTSQVSNAFDVIGAATVRAETNDLDSYAFAILRLINREDLRNQIRAECPALSRQFFDSEQSYPAAVERLLAKFRVSS